MIRKSFLVLSLLFLIAAFAVAADTAKSTSLPAGGGEPGKAYMDYCKAIEKGDMPALRKLVSAERAAQMDSEDFKKMFPMIQAMMAKDIKVTGGTMSATEATLNATGKDSMGGGESTGEISMILEEKQWKVKQDSWKSSMK
jgi:hypothetical protein